MTAVGDLHLVVPLLEVQLGKHPAPAKASSEVLDVWDRILVHSQNTQTFTTIPAVDGGECLRILRVEDGNMSELTSELLLILKRHMVVPGTVVMLGSMTQLAKYGTAWYAGEWIKARNVLKRDLGEVLVVPVLPLVSREVENTTMVRSLMEFLHWVDNLQDPKMELLRGVRRQYVESFLCKVEDGEPWAEELQNLMMPISLYAEGLMLYCIGADSGAACRPA
jgi:hypothetical protein